MEDEDQIETSSLPSQFSMLSVLLSAAHRMLYLSLCGCWLPYSHSSEEQTRTEYETHFQRGLFI